VLNCLFKTSDFNALSKVGPKIFHLFDVVSSNLLVLLR
jgi:hypothetical protein